MHIIQDSLEMIKVWMEINLKLNVIGVKDLNTAMAAIALENVIWLTN